MPRRGPVIAISGPPGSGKTTYAKRLAKDLGLTYHSAGSIFREMASRMGLSLEELSRLAEQDPRIDFEIDRKTLELAEKGGIVIEGHLVAWVLVGVADVLIYIKAPLTVRVERVAKRDGRSLAEALKEISVREMSQVRRFRSYYGFNIQDLSIFDIVVDTSVLGVEEVYHIIKTYTCFKLARLGYSLEGCNIDAKT